MIWAAWTMKIKTDILCQEITSSSWRQKDHFKWTGEEPLRNAKCEKKVCKATLFICYQIAQICRCNVETEIAFHLYDLSMKLNSSSTRQATSDKTLKLGKLKFERGKVSEPQIAGYQRSVKLKDTRENEGFTMVSLCCCQDLGVIIHALLSSANMFPCEHTKTCIYFFDHEVSHDLSSKARFFSFA